MDTIAKITIRCFWLGMALLLFWFSLCVFAGDWMYQTHAKWCNVTPQQVAVIHYGGIMFTKIVVFLFFLFPYIACKLCGKQ